MQTLKRVPYTVELVEFIPHFKDLKEGVFYYSQKYSSANHLCPCGCGEQVPIPINSVELGKKGGWDIFDIDKKFSLRPSLLRRSGCKTHYVFQNGAANII